MTEPETLVSNLEKRKVMEIHSGTKKNPLSLYWNKGLLAVTEEVEWSLEETVTLKTSAFIHTLTQGVQGQNPNKPC